MKDLILKFGHRAIQAVCKDKGWRLPSSEELKDFDSHHENVWVSDPLDDPGEDLPDNYATCYNFETGKTYKCNRSFMQNIVVIKDLHDSPATSD